MRHHIVDYDDDDNDVVEDGDDDDVEGHQKGERRLVSTEPKLPPIKSPLGKVTPPMHADDDWDYDDDG